MKQVKEIVEKFDVSRPIFKLIVDDDGSDISAQSSKPIYQFEPEIVPDCVITEIVNKNYQERFSLRDKSYMIDKRQIEYSSVSEIRSSIKKFLYKNLEMKNPSQSKVYKWADRNMPQTHDFNEVVLSLYKHLRTFCDDDMRIYSRFNKPKADNIIALLEAMQEKYDKR